MNLSDPVSKLYLVGPIYVKRLEKLGISSVEDLLFHFPFRYDDFSLISPISLVQPGETATITGKVEKITNEFTKNAKKIQKAVIYDNSGKIEAIWFNQPFLVKTIKVGETYNFSGAVNWFGREKVFLSPEYEIRRIGGSNCIHTGRLVPVYPETYGISSKWLRSRIKTSLELCVSLIEEIIPPEILQKENLMPEKEAIFQIHFPKDKTSEQEARYRLSYDELFLIQLASLLRKNEWDSKKTSQPIKIDNESSSKFISSLPFDLTASQQKCAKEILEDLQKNKPMNRLLEGDVGSGKTVVAALAAYATFISSCSTLLMAPTEILANQHYHTLTTLLAPLGVPIELVTGSKTIRQLDSKTVRPKIIIGTHALLFQDFDSETVGLVIVDEQHRFGVEQRALLANKAQSPHFLTMTATPIPRTIALTLFGDLDLSVIDEMPKGRIIVKTWVVPKEKRLKAYEWIRQRVKGTREQTFIICPLIEESETLTSIKAVTKEFDLLSKQIFPDLRLGLLHGRMKSKEKDESLKKFKDGDLDILVSTPVVEVGIDIPNATIMMIEGADRFGLAQLHQLRGRVGRSDLQSYCLLFTENENSSVVERLKLLEKSQNGMQLAELDLKLRGPGEIYGTKQHGFPDLKVASFTDLDLIQKTRLAAESIRNLNSTLKNRLEKYKITSISN